MQIVALQPAHLDALDTIYRRATAGLPHCRFAPSRDAVRAALLSAARQRTQLFVATEAGTPQGFAALRGGGRAGRSRREAEMTALFVDDESAGPPLLEAVTDAARVRGAGRLVAFPPEHFHGPIQGYNAGWGGVSDRMAPVAQLLARHGFAPFHRELHLEHAGARYPSTPMPEPPGITVAARSRPDGTTVVAALAGEQEVATCEFSRLDRVSDDPAARQWGYIWGLWVAQTMRRRGMARFLMQRALAHLGDQGCLGCWLTTTSTNWPALALYLALGFEVVDSSTCFRKDV